MRRSHRVLVAACLAASAALAAPAPDRGYPLDIYLRQVDFEELALAPDGRVVAFVVGSSSEAAGGFAFDAWRSDLSGERPAPPERLTEDAACSGLAWSPDGRQLGFIGPDPGGGETLLLAPGSAGRPAPLRGAEPLPEGIVAYAWAPDSRSIFVAAIARPEPAEPDAASSRWGDVRVDASERPAPGSALFRVLLEPAAPGDGRLRVAGVESLGRFPHRIGVLAPAADGERLAWSAYPSSETRDPFSGSELWLREADGRARPLTDNALREGAVYGRPGLVWAADGRSLFTTAWGRDPAGDFGQWRLYRVGVEDGSLRRVAGAFEGAFLGLQRLDDGSLLTLGVESTSVRAYRVAPDSDRIAPLFPERGRVWLASATARGDRVAFVLEDAERFAEVHVAPGSHAFTRSQAVTAFHAELQALPRPEVETISWDGSEGTRIEGVVWWPPGRRRSGPPLPLVVDLHGGPWLARAETVGLAVPSAHIPALLASRGYLVLSPNHRGSAGRGDAFLQAIRDRPCSVPVADVLAGVNALVERGWADAERMGVMGHSWGGTLANCLITRTDRFRAACTDAGIWNFTSALASRRLPWDWGFLFSADAPWLDARYWTESPIAGAGNLTTPTLATIGEASGGVAVSQARELYRALRFAGVPARLLVFPGEGELIARPDHQRIKLEAELEWLDRWLGTSRN